MESTTTIRTVKVRVTKTVRAEGRTTRKEKARTVRTEKRTTAQERKLRFQKGNAKLGRHIATFSLPAGWTCPFAEACQSRADRKSGKIQDGKRTRFRCFSASAEAIYGNVRESRWANLEALKGLTTEQMAELILEHIPRKVTVVRPHISGDFYSQAYFDAWLCVARRRPDLIVYFYTKSLRYWVARLAEVGTGCFPGAVANIVPTASKGGRDDALIEEYGLRSAIVVYSEEEAKALGLEIDADDSHAMAHGPDFALLIHGSQPAGSSAAKAIASLRSQGEFGYGKRADEIRAKRRSSLPLVSS